VSGASRPAIGSGRQGRTRSRSMPAAKVNRFVMLSTVANFLSVENVSPVWS
jgi:hypothetical protein